MQTNTPKEAERCTSPPNLAAISGSSSMATPTSQADSDEPAVDPYFVTLFKNLTPPKKVNVPKCQRLSKRFGIDWDNCDDEQKKVLSFLFDRGVHGCLEEGKFRPGEDKTAAVGEMLRQAMNDNEEIGRRVKVMVYERGHNFFSKVPDHVQHYQDFLNERPEWRGDPDDPQQESEDFVNLLEEPYGLEVFQQVQLSGNCYLHAAVLAYHYLCCWHKLNGAEDRIIDIPRYMRHTFSAKDIKDHLFDNEGGRSENILVRLAGHMVTPESPLRHVNKEDWLHKLNRRKVEDMKMYGPKLFSNVLLPKDFGQAHSYKGDTSTFFTPEERNDPKIDTGRHAMLIVGVRKDDAGKWLFLFQNSHEQTQFFEADYDWVVESLGTPYYLHFDRGDWFSQSFENPYFNTDDLMIYSQASPAVDKSSSSDQTKSFFYSEGTEHIKEPPVAGESVLH